MDWAGQYGGRGGVFAWSSLDRRAPERLHVPARVRGQMVPRGQAGAFAEACGRLLGRAVSLEVIATWFAEEPPSQPGDLRVTLALGDMPRLALSIESALALRLASHAAGYPFERADGARALEAEVVGAATASMVLAARCTGAPWRLAAGEPLRGPVGCARAVVMLDDDLFEVVAAVPSAEAQTALALEAHPLAALGVDVRALAALGDVPLSLPVVLAITQATGDDFEALMPGAAWIPGETWTARLGADGSWHGTALLAAPLSEAGLTVEVDAASGQWRLGGVWRRGSHGPTEIETGEEADALYAVRVEAGEVTMPACAWADLAPGAVLPAPARNVMTLRAGGEVIARGRAAALNGEQAVLLEAVRHGKQGASLWRPYVRRLGLSPLQGVDEPVELGREVGVEVTHVGFGPQAAAGPLAVDVHVDRGCIQAEFAKAGAQHVGIGGVHAKNDASRSNEGAERLAREVDHQARFEVERTTEKALGDQPHDVQHQPFACGEPARFGRAQKQPRGGARRCPRLSSFALCLRTGRRRPLLRLGQESVGFGGDCGSPLLRLFDDRFGSPARLGDDVRFGSSVRFSRGRVCLLVRAHELDGQDSSRSRARYAPRWRCQGRVGPRLVRCSVDCGTLGRAAV